MKPKHIKAVIFGLELFAAADNRLENLELWTTIQPSGQRVEDKIAFAKEILREYGEI